MRSEKRSRRTSCCAANRERDEMLSLALIHFKVVEARMRMLTIRKHPSLLACLQLIE